MDQWFHASPPPVVFSRYRFRILRVMVGTNSHPRVFLSSISVTRQTNTCNDVTRQAVVIISILLQFLNKIDRQELKPAVWKGAFAGAFGAIAIGIGFIIAYYQTEEQFFTGRTEYVVEAILVRSHLSRKCCCTTSTAAGCTSFIFGLTGLMPQRRPLLLLRNLCGGLFKSNFTTVYDGSMMICVPHNCEPFGSKQSPLLDSWAHVFS